MSIGLNPTLIELNDSYIEAYERESLVSEETKVELGLEDAAEIKAKIGISSVPEYVVLSADNLQQGTRTSFLLNSLEQSIEILSVFIDTPNQDSIDFEIYISGDKIFDITLGRNKTPYRFPPNVLTPDVEIKMYARTNIEHIRIYARLVQVIAAIDAEITQDF